ncbi:MAG: hypothetical protein ACUZ8O_06055, partial [Candidatus Anammoxibacter sp.]
YLYSILPYAVDYEPYTTSHIMTQMQLLLFAALGVTFLLLSGIYPSEIRAINVDVDWLYRKGAIGFMWLVNNTVYKVGNQLKDNILVNIPHKLMWVSKNPVAFLQIAVDMFLLPFSGEQRKVEIRIRLEEEKAAFPGTTITPSPIGNTLLFITVFLLAYLLIDFITN